MVNFKMEREDQMENEKYIFKGNSSQSPDKLTALREQSQASHINRIRIAIEKREKQEFERLNFGLLKKSNKRSSNATTKKGKSTRIFSNENDLNGTQLSDDDETNRFLTLHVNNSFCRSLKHSGDMGHGVDDYQGGIHIISTSQGSKSLKSTRDGSKKRRKQWSKTTQTIPDATKAEKENTAEKTGGDGYSEKSYSMKNTQEFNSILNERSAESLEYVEKRMLARRPATEKYANVVQWNESLSSPESVGPILDTAQDALQDTFSEKRAGLHPSSKKDMLAKQKDSANSSKTVARGHKDAKSSKKSLKKGIKQSRNASGMSEIMLNECKGKKERISSLSKKGEPSTRIGLKATKDNPLRVVHTSNGNLKIIICFKKLKPKDTALLVRFGDFKHSKKNEENNTTSSRKLKKGFTYLNDQQMEFFENIFKNKDATADERSE